MPSAMKIAIIDDEKDMRQSISQWLALSGYETESYWTEEGWQWREKENIQQPKYWKD